MLSRAISRTVIFGSLISRVDLSFRRTVIIFGDVRPYQMQGREPPTAPSRGPVNGDAPETDEVRAISSKKLVLPRTGTPW
jgi:hypothetical protein